MHKKVKVCDKCKHPIAQHSKRWGSRREYYCHLCDCSLFNPGRKIRMKF